MTALEPVEAGPQVRALLSASDLPTGDLDEDAVRLYALREDGELVGAGGLERYGSVALLRSVVVAEPHRGRGLGTHLCGELEATANELGVETLVLLTTTASGFFGDRGYTVVERSDVPERIRETAEFAELCPDSATCMHKRL